MKTLQSIQSFINKSIWGILYTSFAIDYFILSPSEQKVQTCLFWIVLAVFMIWSEVKGNKQTQ